MQRKILNFLSSRTFLYIIVGIFALQALWIALTGRYPGAFDENFHFGLIQLYAKHWLPFLDAQPPNAEVYGAVARDPSYLYHYIMSFPYRLVALFTHSQTTQIIVLRVLNVLLATTGLLLYARVLRRSKLSTHVQHAILLLFVAVPIFPVLAGQINYDNLLLIFVALAVGWTIDFISAVQRGVLSGRLLLQILIVCLLASLTKYAFLPLFFGIVVYLSIQVLLHRKTLLPHGLKTVLKRYLTSLRRWQAAALVVAVLLVGGLFFQRFGINMVRYHTPVPDCAQVITAQECSAYAPWQRDYNFVHENTEWKREHMGVYANMWIHQMVREMYFSVYGAFFPNTTIVDYKTVEPLPFMIILGWTLLISGLVAVLLYLSKLWRDPVLQLFALIVFLYVGALFYQNYQAYVETAVPVAIHGRYLLPVLPVLGIIYFRAFGLLFKDLQRWVKPVNHHRQAVLLGGWTLLMLVCLQGGGIITHIIRSDSQWFWQQSSPAQNVNNTARKLLRPVIVEEKL